MITYKDQKLFIDDKIIFTFSCPIVDILVYDNVIVTLIDSDCHQNSNENVYGIDYNGKLLWQVPKYKYLSSRCPFVRIKKEGENLKMINWDSDYIIMDPKTLEIIINPRQSRKGRRPW